MTPGFCVLLYQWKPDGTGKIARTQYTTMETFPQYTLLKVMPKTGRTHQIRVHLRAFGHPIVGDQLYHSRKYKKELNAHHPLLAATQLTFTDLQGKPQSYHMAIPEYFASILTELRTKYPDSTKTGQSKKHEPLG
ncbi:pseudouridine synthase [Patescibacteria group bacterium]